MRLGVMFLLTFMASVALAQVASPAAAVVTTPAASGIFGWVTAHLPQVSFVVYVVCDVLIYFIPSLKANGIFQQLMIWAGRESGQTPSAPAQQQPPAA